MSITETDQDSYYWIIKNASLHLDALKDTSETNLFLRSGIFRLHGKWWVAKFYLRGDNTEIPDNNGKKSSIYLTLISDGLFHANLGVRLEGSSIRTDEMDTEKNKCIFTTSKGWGFPTFVPWENLTSCIKEDDTLHLKFTIKPLYSK
jgi:hypothetical protein